MLINEIILEHSDWVVDETYTKEDLQRINLAMRAIKEISAARGIKLNVRDHFFDQLQKQRGFGKTTAEMLISTFGKVLNRGLHLFKGKEDRTTLVFYDKVNGLNIPFMMIGDEPTHFLIPTMIRATKWLGKEQKVEV